MTLYSLENENFVHGTLVRANSFSISMGFLLNKQVRSR